MVIAGLFIDGETVGKGDFPWPRSGCHGNSEARTGSLSRGLSPVPPLEPPGVTSQSYIAHTSSVWPSGWNYSPLIELKTRGD